MAAAIEEVVEQVEKHVLAHFRDYLAGVIGEKGYAVRLIPFGRENIYKSLRYAGWRTPALFILPQGTDRDQRAENFYYAKHRVILAALVEERNELHLQYAVWRYTRALQDLFFYSPLDGDGTFLAEWGSTDFGGIWTRRPRPPELSTFRADGYITLTVHELSGG